MSLYDQSAKSLEGADVAMASYRGRVLLIVNVASKCGFTPQYAGLEALYRKYHDRGFEVLAFPCDQFGHQEPGDAQEIQSFCSLNYAVTFPLFAKIKVNGPDAHPVYGYLKSALPGILGLEGIKWNFTKFLVGPDGQVAERFAPITSPDAIKPKIEKLLAAM